MTGPIVTPAWHQARADERAREAFPDAVLTGDVFAWSTNGQHPMADLTAIWARLGLITPEQEAATNAARQAESARFFAAYRAAQPAEPSAEERAEMLAAFGPGEVVVDVISGRRVQL